MTPAERQLRWFFAVQTATLLAALRDDRSAEWAASVVATAPDAPAGLSLQAFGLHAKQYVDTRDVFGQH